MIKPRKRRSHSACRVMCCIELVGHLSLVLRFALLLLVSCLEFLQNFLRLHRHFLNPPSGIPLLCPLFIGYHSQFVFDEIELADVELLNPRGILNRNEILSREWLIAYQVLPVLGLDVELLNRLIAENVSGCRHTNDVRVFREWPKQSGALKSVIVAVIVCVLREVQLYQRLPIQRQTRNWILLKVFDEVGDRFQLENISSLVHVRMLEWNMCETAVVEGKSFELDVLVLEILCLVSDEILIKLCWDLGRFEFYLFTAIELRPLRVRQVHLVLLMLLLTHFDFVALLLWENI